MLLEQRTTLKKLTFANAGPNQLPYLKLRNEKEITFVGAKIHK